MIRLRCGLALLVALAACKSEDKDRPASAARHVASEGPVSLRVDGSEVARVGPGDDLLSELPEAHRDPAGWVRLTGRGTKGRFLDLPQPGRQGGLRLQIERDRGDLVARIERAGGARTGQVAALYGVRELDVITREAAGPPAPAASARSSLPVYLDDTELARLDRSRLTELGGATPRGHDLVALLDGLEVDVGGIELIEIEAGDRTVRLTAAALEPKAARLRLNRRGQWRMSVRARGERHELRDVRRITMRSD